MNKKLLTLIPFIGLYFACRQMYKCELAMNDWQYITSSIIQGVSFGLLSALFV